MNLDFIAKPMGMLLRLLYNLVSALDVQVLSAYAIALILATIVVKLIVLPLTFKQTKSMKIMQDLAPKMNELQEKYAKDPQTLQRKQMELYKEANYNPLSGCLPMLIQLPLIFAFFWVIKDPGFAFGDMGHYFTLAELAQQIGINLVDVNATLKAAGDNTIKTLQALIAYANTAQIDATSITNAILINNDKFWIWTQEINRSFFWIKDLGYNSNFIFLDGTVNGLNMGFNIPFVGYALPILAAISGYTTYLTSKMTMSTQAATMNEQQKSTQSMMTIMMPVMIFISAIQFPSGLALYWVVSNIFQLVQQWIILNSSKKAKEVK